MSRAARDLVTSPPRSGSDLPVVDVNDLIIAEAVPDPPPGPLRDQLVAANETRARAAQDALRSVLESYLDRSLAVVLARARGPKARKGTRWWTTEIKVDGASFEVRAFDHPQRTEIKALDPGYIVPDKMNEELANELQPVALRIATDAATDVAHRLGDDGGIGDVDMDEIAAAVDDVVGRLLGVAQRHAAEIRTAVLDADKTAEDLDEVLDRIEAAHRKGGNWLLMSGNTLANALINDAALREAMRLGVTHVQWISRRDGRVRPTHVRADGQVRRVGRHFRVGLFDMLHPSDPTDLPDSWPEVANCRCGLRFRRPDKGVQGVLDLIFAGDGDDRGDNVNETLKNAVITAAESAGGGLLIPTPSGDDLPPVAAVVTTDRPFVGHRVLSGALDVVPGQVINLPGALTLGLLAPAEGAGFALTVAIPAGVAVGYAAGSVILPEGTTLEILSATASGVGAVVVEKQPPV